MMSLDIAALEAMDDASVVQDHRRVAVPPLPIWDGADQIWADAAIRGGAAVHPSTETALTLAVLDETP